MNIFFLSTVSFLILLSVIPSIKSAKSKSTFTCPSEICGEVEIKDCLNCDGFLSTDEDHGICFDRHLFQPHNTDHTDHEDHYHYLWNDIVGAFVWFVMAGVATACGVGGGGIYVPLGILLFQFAPKQASGLSQASIFGASLGGLLLNFRNHHPEEKIRSDAGIKTSDKELPQQKKNSLEEDKAYEDTGNDMYSRPLIDFDMALFLSPMEMAGAVLGVVIQKVLPNWLYLLIAALVLSFTAYKTYKKFFQAREKERKEEQTNAEASEGVEVLNEKVEDTNIEGGCSENSDKKKAASGNNDNNVENNNTTDEKDVTENEKAKMEEESSKLRKEYLREDMCQYPRDKIFSLLILWIGLFLLTLFKGGKGVTSVFGIDCKSPWYYVLIALQFLWMFSFAIFYGIKIMRKQAARLKVQYPYLPEDPVWNAKSVRFFGVFTFIAGIIAGLIGIGGGMVLGPLMLVMGIHPRVSSATTATMIVLTSSSVAVMFVTSGLVPWSYALFYFLICLCGAVIGKSKIDGYVKRTGRSSLLIFILATIIAFATIGCIFIMFLRLADADWEPAGFNKFCSLEKDNNVCGNATESLTNL
mmetsp:Transcript_35687/g.40694  ORF Transcript_35687/g.40694 Transcript_35687/m.40694 type:complete len:584 (+) Transcript_35687:74-1825(+)